jgi:hypothetical protein
VFETATGRELARRKSVFVNDLVLLHDNQTLAIPLCGMTISEPIAAWDVLGGITV